MRARAFDQPATRRAIVGYLLACPEPKAAEYLASLRKHDPKGVAAAEEALSLTTSVAPSER